MRDDGKTWTEGLPPAADEREEPSVPSPFKSTFHSGTVPPPPEDDASTSGMRRLQLGDGFGKNTLLVHQPPPAPETLKSLTPAMTAPSEAGDESEVLQVEPAHASPRYGEGVFGRTIHGLPKSDPPKRGPQTRGEDVTAVRVQAIGEGGEPALEAERRAFNGRSTDPSPHKPGSTFRSESAPARPMRGAAVGTDQEPPAGGRLSFPGRPSLTTLARNRKLNRVLVIAVGLAAAVVLVSELGLLDFRSSGPSTDDEAQEPQAAAGTVETVGVSAATAQEAPQDLPVHGPITVLESVPSGAEVVFHGAVIANTPARIPRDRQDGDYLLRKQGFQTQLVRIGQQSPASITLELKPLAGLVRARDTAIEPDPEGTEPAAAPANAP